MTISLAPPVVRRAIADEAGPLATTLARAFHHDPVNTYFFSAERSRLARAERFYRVTVLERTCFPDGAVYAAGGWAGVAAWVAPGRAHKSLREQLRTVPELLRIGGRDIPRQLRAVALMDRHHPREPHWYLWFLGVAPEAQGRGLGAALMEPALERCDAEGMPAYLDATTWSIRRYYERFGFEVTGELTLPGGPTMWPMWREPR
jgi:ribosomal protein S18 acetylase RimI-like enzyme